MQRIPGLIALGAVALAGCNLSTDLTTTKRVGAINVDQFGTGDTAKLRVTGVFFQPGPNDRLQIPNSARIRDTCWVGQYVLPEDPTLIRYDNLNAGPSIAVSTDKVDTVLKPVQNSVGTVVYSVPGGGLLPFTPGSNVTFDISGDTGGFPAKSINVRTLTPLDLTPVERHPEDDLRITWSPAGSPVGAVHIQMLYSDDSSVSPNQSLNCDMRDDGSYNVPSFTTAGWTTASDESQSISGYRWETLLQSDQDVLMDVILQTPIDNPRLEDAVEPDPAVGASGHN